MKRAFKIFIPERIIKTYASSTIPLKINDFI